MRTKGEWLLHNRIYRSWLKSYLLLLIIPLLLMVGSFAAFSNAMEDMISKQWDETLQTARAELDAEFAELERLGTYCSLDEYVQAYARMDSLEAIQASGDRLGRIRGLNKAMTYYTVGMDFANAHYLYFHRSGLMYTGGTFFTSQEVHQLPRNAAVSYALRHTDQAVNGYIGCFKPEAAAPFAVFRTVSLYSANTIPTCTVLTELNMDAVNSKMAQYAAMFSGWMGLMDPSGRFLFAGGQDDCRVAEDEALLLDGMTTSVNVGSRRVFMMPSAQNGMYYVFAMNRMMLRAQLSPFYIMMGLIMALMVLLSALTIHRQILRNYKPLHTLATTIISTSGSTSGTSAIDYPYLTASLLKSAEQKKIMKQTLNEQLLRQMIHHRSEEIEVSEQHMALLEEYLPGEYYLVLCLPLHDRDWARVYGKADGRISAEELRHVLLEPLAAQLEDGCAVTGLPVEDYYAILFSCDPAMARIKAESSFYRFVQQQEQQQRRFILASSCLHDSPLDLHQAYREATAAMRMNFSREQTPVVFFDDLPQQSGVHPYAAEKRQQLANFMSMGRGEEALALLRELRQQARGDGSMELLCWLDNIHTISQVLMNSSLQTHLDEATCREYVRQLDILASSTSRSFRRRDEAMDSFVERLCRDIAALQAEMSGNDRSALVRSIDALIQQRLSDENLSISMLAEEIGLNPKYMAMQYKEIKGVGLLYSIHQQRIDAFKQILAQQPNISIAQASAAVGYSSQNTLIRWFRKIEGVTPGEYRRING